MGSREGSHTPGLHGSLKYRIESARKGLGEAGPFARAIHPFQKTTPIPEGEGYMRSTKLPAIATAAAAMLALAPAGASAAARPSPPESAPACKPSRALPLLEHHRRTRPDHRRRNGHLFGALTCLGGPSTTPQTITVYGRTAGASYQALGTTNIESGAYSFQSLPIKANTAFYASSPEARSPQRVVRVEPVVTLKGPNEKIPLITGRTNAVLFTGSVSPQDAGARVVLQRENAISHEEWRVIQRGGLVTENGEFAITHKFVVPGDANIRVVVQGNGRHLVRGISNELNYNISQKENPNLTLNSSGDPIFFGQPVTLSGTVAGAVNQPVTLFGRGRGASYAQVAQGTTNNKGEYSFTQSPLVSTFYRVTSAGKSSAVLFEGVKYVLTAGVSGTSVQAGQPLTFSGTLTPGVLGHPVYLERENASGGGFHVVEVGTVGEHSTYSITAPIYGSGKENFRIKVPGDPANQSASSASFSVEVTHSPAPAFKPGLPSKLPQEGQL